MVCTVLAIAILVVLAAGASAPRRSEADDLRDEVRRLRESADRMERAARDAEAAARRADDEVRALRREMMRRP